MFKKNKPKPKKVLVFGTFDLLHKGHVDFFRQAGRYGKVTAVVARDKTVFSVKKRRPVQNEKTRLRNIKKLKKLVDRALLGNFGNKYDVVEKTRPDVICLGYDQNSFTKELKKRKITAAIKRLSPYKPHLYKSIIIRGINKNIG